MNAGGSASIRTSKDQNGQIMKKTRHLSLVETNRHCSSGSIAAEDDRVSFKQKGRHTSNKSESKAARKNATAANEKARGKDVGRTRKIPKPASVTVEAPSKQKADEPKRLPDGVINIDVEDGFYEYAAEVIVYLRQREQQFVLPPNYLEGGSTTSDMRAMLVDWLIQVVKHLDQCQETLYLCVIMLDTVLSKRDIKNDRLQLVGITCLLIASKLEEYYPADISKLIHLTMDSYTFKQVIRMEMVILDILDYQLYFPEIMSFLRRYSRAACRHQDRKFVETCQFLVDSVLVDNCFSTILPSKQAAASVLAASLLYSLNAEQNPNENSLWTPTLQHYTSYNFEDVVYTARTMIRSILNTKDYNAAKDKYNSRSKFQGLAKAAHLSSTTLTKAETWIDLVLKS